MAKTIVNSQNAPAPIGPYNQAVKAGGFLFTSGQIPIDTASGNVVTGGVQEQTEKVFENLQAVLAEAGLSLTDVVKTTVFLKNMSDFAAMNTVYAKHVAADAAPARSTVEVARLPKDVLVEIEAVAVFPT